MWSRISNGVGGLVSSVKRWFSRSRVSNSCPPPHVMSRSSSPPPPPPPSQSSVTSAAVSWTLWLKKFTVFLLFQVTSHPSPPYNPPPPPPPPTGRTHLSHRSPNSSHPVAQSSHSYKVIPPRQNARQTTSLPPSPPPAPRSKYNRSNESRLWTTTTTTTQGTSFSQEVCLVSECQLFSTIFVLQYYVRVLLYICAVGETAS